MSQCTYIIYTTQSYKNCSDKKPALPIDSYKICLYTILDLSTLSCKFSLCLLDLNRTINMTLFLVPNYRKNTKLNPVNKWKSFNNYIFKSKYLNSFSNTLFNVLYYEISKSMWHFTWILWLDKTSIFCSS